MISLEAIKTIDSIDRKGSFAGAADELYRVPSALTYTIKKLEEQLSVKIFDRKGQRAVLTASGRLMLERGREILRQVSQLEEQAQEVERGYETQLRIVVDTVLPLAPLWQVLSELQQEHAWLNIQLFEEALSGSWEVMLSGRADLLIGATGDEPAGGLWRRQIIAEISMPLYCASSHPAAQLTQPIQHQDLQPFTHIIVSDSANHLPGRNVGLLGLQQVLAVASMTQKYQALIHGAGISHLPVHLARTGIEQGLLTELVTEADIVPQTLLMAWPKSASGRCHRWLREKIIQDNLFNTYLDGYQDSSGYCL